MSGDLLPTMAHDDLPQEINDLTRQVLEAALEVHSTTGSGMLEKVYRICLVEELRHRGLSVEVEVPVAVQYRSARVERAFKVDLVVEGKVVVELKSVQEVSEVHLSQLVTYLKLSKHQVGLLINFNVPRLRKGIFRRVYTSQ